MRLAATLSHSDNLTAAKPFLWSDTTRMIRDFPLVGVGIGGWPEIFPHYQRPPWLNTFFFREPENDYLQLLAETGVVGLALVLWFAWAIGVRLREGAAHLSSRDWPLLAGFAGGVTAALIHEIFDFSLQTPANMVLFTTGLGTPTGNAIAPVVKLSTNSALAARMPDIIDIDTGAVVNGDKTIEQMGEEILERVIQIASGEAQTKAELLGQDDFIPWKRGVSL